jgi:hypothetical protein
MLAAGVQRITGLKGGYASIMAHYQQVVKGGDFIRGMGECSWSRDIITGHPGATIKFRFCDYAYFAPWSWINSWPNFLEGMNAERHPWVRDKYGDRKDGVDGWGSPVNQAGAKPKGVFFAYKGNTPLARFAGQAVLDAWVQTGDPRGRKMAELLGAGLAAAQSTHGSWPVTGLGYFGWKAGLGDWSKQGWRDWGAAEMLYILGRIRRDCRTEQFRETEDRAYRYVMEQQVAGMVWPASDHHSFTWGYPIWPHSQAAMYFIRYLLELAPAERRDVALAERLALWCEDLDVDWGRRDGPQQGEIRPRVRRGDRHLLSPDNNTSFLALVCLQLHRATGKRLWLAKADALITACLQAQDPVSGVFSEDLRSEVLSHDGWVQQCFGWYALNLLEYDRLRVGIQPALVVGSASGKADKKGTTKR